MVSSSSWLKSRPVRQHSTFSENRLNRSRDSDILRCVAHAPERLHEEITADYKWRLKHRAVADSLEEAGERLFTSFHFSSVGTPSCRTRRRGAQCTTGP